MYLKELIFLSIDCCVPPPLCLGVLIENKRLSMFHSSFLGILPETGLWHLAKSDINWTEERDLKCGENMMNCDDLDNEELESYLVDKCAG